MSTIIDLGKLRFLWRGAYSAGSSYELNDVVAYGGNSYVYINTLATSGNLPDNATYWSQMSDGLALKGDWDAGTTYTPGDLVNVSGIVYKNKQTSTGNEPPNATYWEVFLEGFKYKGTWSSATAYKVNDVAIQNGVNYICIQNLSLIHI